MPSENKQSLVELRALLGTVSSKQSFRSPSHTQAAFAYTVTSRARAQLLIRNREALRNPNLKAFKSGREKRPQQVFSSQFLYGSFASPSEPKRCFFSSFYVFLRARASPKAPEDTQSEPERAPDMISLEFLHGFASPRSISLEFLRVFARPDAISLEFSCVFASPKAISLEFLRVFVSPSEPERAEKAISLEF